MPRRSRLEMRAKRTPVPRQFVAESHEHRRSFIEIALDRKRTLEPFDGKSFTGLRMALAMKRQSSDRGRP
jgi:hypothetical protein